jgi:hypothetical protein
MSSKKLFKLAAGALALAAVGMSSAQAGVISQSIMTVSGVRFSLADGVSNAGGSNAGSLIPLCVSAACDGSNPLDRIVLSAALNTGDVSAELNGTTVVDSAIVGAPAGFNLTKATGPDAGNFVPGTVLLAPVPGAVDTYTGSNSSLSGNALNILTGATSVTDNTVQLDTAGSGSAQSNSGVNGEFTFNVAAPQAFEISFVAELDILSHVGATPGQSGFAQSSSSWVAELLDGNGNSVFTWNPNGLAGGIVGGVEMADTFNLNRTSTRFTPGQAIINNGPAYFEAETGLLAVGQYTLSIRQTTTGDATFRAPEPAGLAILGLVSVIGGAFTRRVRRNRA